MQKNNSDQKKRKNRFRIKHFFLCKTFERVEPEWIRREP